METPVFHPGEYKDVIVDYKTVIIKDKYEVKTVVNPGEYGWVSKTTERILKFNEYKTPPTTKVEIDHALDTMGKVLDFLGFMPLFGTVVDAANVAVSIMKSDYISALLNTVNLFGDAVSNAITAPFKLLIAAANNVDQLAAALKAIKAAAGIVGDASKYISEMFTSLMTTIGNITDNIGDVAKSGVFLMLSKEMKDKLAGFLEMIGTGISKAMTAIDAQVADLMGKVTKAEGIKVLNYKPTSGARIIATPGKTSTVLGRYGDDIQYVIKELDIVKTLDYNGNPGGFNVLNVPDELYVNPQQFWDQYNVPFLDKAISRGDDIIMATEPTGSALRDAISGELTGFGREFEYLKKAGYIYDNVNKVMRMP